MQDAFKCSNWYIFHGWGKSAILLFALLGNEYQVYLRGSPKAILLTYMLYLRCTELIPYWIRNSVTILSILTPNALLP